MPDSAPAADQFWLMTGEVPSGPFTVEQIHEKIATGDATWETPACPVGGSTWLPLVRMPGIGPAVPASPTPTPEGSSTPIPDRPHTPPTPNRPTPPPLPTSTPTEPTAKDALPETPPAASDRKSDLIGVGVGVGILLLAIVGIGYGGYWVWEQFRPPTATEVCKKLDEAKTAAEAKKYATTRMHPLIDAEYASGQRTDPNSEFVFTQEVDGPKPDTKHVGFRGSFFLTEAGRRVQMEGHCTVVKSDGWKVDDMIVTGVEGASLPGPVSLVDEHRASLTQPKAPTPGATLPGAKPRPPGAGPYVPPKMQETAWQRHPVGKVVNSIRDTIGWGGIVAIVVLIVVGLTVRESLRKKAPPG